MTICSSQSSGCRSSGRRSSTSVAALTRVGASPVQLVDTGRRHGSLASVRLEGRGSIVGDWEIVCVLQHQGGSTQVEPCIPMSERAGRAPRRGPCALRGVPDGATANADVHRARTRNRADDPAGIVLPSPIDGHGVGRGGDPTRADRGEDPNRPCRRRATAARSWGAVHRHQHVSRPRRQRRTQSRISPQRRGATPPGGRR